MGSEESPGVGLQKIPIGLTFAGHGNWTHLTLMIQPSVLTRVNKAEVKGLAEIPVQPGHGSSSVTTLLNNLEPYPSL